MDRQELLILCDLLNGNINRMMVTDDMNELLAMYSFALDRIKTIYSERWKIILNEKFGDEKLFKITKEGEAE